MSALSPRWSWRCAPRTVETKNFSIFPPITGNPYFTKIELLIFSTGRNCARRVNWNISGREMTVITGRVVRYGRTAYFVFTTKTITYIDATWPLTVPEVSITNNLPRKARIKNELRFRAKGASWEVPPQLARYFCDTCAFHPEISLIIASLAHGATRNI